MGHGGVRVRDTGTAANAIEEPQLIRHRDPRGGLSANGWVALDGHHLYTMDRVVSSTETASHPCRTTPCGLGQTATVQARLTWPLTTTSHTTTNTNSKNVSRA